MYIAQRWLLGMVLAMWIALCSIDIYVKDFKHHMNISESNRLNYLKEPLVKNSSTRHSYRHQESYKRKEINRPVRNNGAILQYITFSFGACLVLLYYKKNELMLYAAIKFKTIKTYDMKKQLAKIQTLKMTGKKISIAILKYVKTTLEMMENLRIFVVAIYKQKTTPKQNAQNVNLILLNKLKEFSLERRNLGHILLATIQENKNIKMQYQLEMLAKKRLVKQIETAQKQMKENRCRYVGFQQLYTIAHQENNFLKSRIRKLAQDKEEAEKNLLKLVNYVWQSKNNELKAFCSRLIVKTKNNLINSDAKVEIDQFIKQSAKAKRLPEHESNKTHSLDTIKEVNENREEGDFAALVKDAPKLRGLPGECVWTVKDKDGFIEKLYEYDTDFDNGDTIRRIRQYSVYYDKDCLLDVSSSTTLIQNSNIDLPDLRSQYINKCITSSQAFQKFLRNNKIIVLSRRSPPSPQLTY